eukprot:4710515-Amphidinium_carterae.1
MLVFNDTSAKKPSKSWTKEQTTIFGLFMRSFLAVLARTVVHPTSLEALGTKPCANVRAKALTTTPVPKFQDHNSK